MSSVPKNPFSMKLLCAIVLIAALLLTIGILMSQLTEIRLDSDDLSSWVGSYYFDEFWSAAANDMVHSLTQTIDIYESEDCYYADIEILGFQIWIRIRARVVGNQEEISLLFESYLHDNAWESGSKGDLLLRLERKGSEIFTHWGIMHPVLIENET